jgi:hypothetical protein
MPVAGTSFANSPRRVSEIALVEVSGGGPPSELEVPIPIDESVLALRFVLSASGDHGLEAVRNARRALLREELTRGRNPEEPSLSDAVFSAREILWVVRREQRERCLEMIEELQRRANFLLTETDAGSTDSSGHPA